MSFFDGGFLMIVIFSFAIFGLAYWPVRNSHTKKASSIQSESRGQDEDDCELGFNDNQHPFPIYGFDGWPTNLPKVPLDVDITKL